MLYNAINSKLKYRTALAPLIFSLIVWWATYRNRNTKGKISGSKGNTVRVSDADNFTDKK